MTNGNQKRKYEEERIRIVLREIDKKVVKLDYDSGGLKKDVIHLKKTFWDDVKINLDNPEDAGETLSSIRQQAEMLSERERTHRQLDKQRKTLSRLKDSPYFARVDFLENGEETTNNVYLGVASLMNEKEEKFLIYDWRAPISSIYYDYSPGPAQYETVEGMIQGEMQLKRQFITKDGQIKTMFDTGVTIGDELLKEILGNNASINMKSIVATIQKEQNQIIRNVKSKYLVVQGVAGSGKTSAALQRVAYLLYRYQDEITAENIMLFSPNSLFNRYIASVLPDLGEDNMQQLTFQEYVEKRLGKQFDVEHPFTQMEYMLTCQEHKMYSARRKGIRYKASNDFKSLIDSYVVVLSNEDYLIFKNISFRGEMLIRAEQIKSYFYSLDASISIPNRMQLVKEWLLKELVKKEKLERTKDWVIEESDLLDLEEYTKVYSELLKEGRFSENTFDDFEQEQKKIAKKIVKKHFKPIRTAVKKLKFINVVALYSQLFKQKDNIYQKLNDTFPEGWEEICSYTLKKLHRKELTYEDAAPYLYLQDKLEGKRINTRIRHLFIDEAQDYSPFQFFVLKQLFPYCRMTILGDFNQAIYAHTLNAPTLLSNELYVKENFEKVVLTKSYRSTRQIVEFTKGIIEEGETIEAFNRNGQKPTFTKVEDLDTLQSRITKKIRQLQSANHETIAVICKTGKESWEAYDRLSKQINIQLMEHNTSSYRKGILILPAYLAKGIEFDAVIIYDASDVTYGREFERKLFYTACTRAMHELHLFSVGEMSPFMNKIPANSYEITE
ncbi:UvrD-helicase domain-containing protein [Priestia aryabhattai]|uniref:RNA polymerase recycling motor HelD n=1 Tax=Priestia aryabhattai TaxID=412384 RepID=UPI00211CEBF2|nr:RNA polymerase recycling motor HelD [Priestia aryabhattai]MCQ9285218.1 UvrD-helicase domain-containing protein [Priestia aryabhattai]